MYRQINKQIKISISNSFFSFVFLIYICVVMVLLLSCSFDYEEGNLADELDKTLPDVVIDDVTIYFVRGTTVSMSAKKIEIYSSRSTQEMYDIKFSEKNKKDEVRMLGNADFAIVETDTNNVTILGNFFVRSNNDEAEIKTNYLQWFDEDKRIEGSDTERIFIKRDDGSTIEGFGFRADAQERTISLKGDVKGKLAVDE